MSRDFPLTPEALDKELEVVASPELVGAAANGIISCIADTTGLAQILGHVERRWHAGDPEVRADAKQRLGPLAPMLFEAKDKLLCALASLSRMGIGDPVDSGGGGD